MPGMMLVCVVLLVGTAFFVRALRVPFEDAVPLTFMATPLLIYVGVLLVGGSLRAVSLGVCGLMVVLGVGALVHSAVRRELDGLWEDYATWGLAAFVAAMVALVYIEHGRMASAWDEFSHWMDVVKAMIDVDDFATNPLSHSRFVTYPPVMSLLQCVFEFGPSALSGEVLFVEWTPYVAYQLFCLALLMPVIRRVSHGTPLGTVAATLLVALTPLALFPKHYQIVYIDAFVGIAAAAGFLVVLADDGRERLVWRVAYVSMVCATLVLAKAIGTFYAALVALGFCAKEALVLAGGRQGEPAPKGRHMATHAAHAPGRPSVTSVAPLLVPLVATALAKASWDAECRLSGATSTLTQGSDFLGYLALWFTHGDTSYRQVVIDSFKEAIVTRTLALGATGVEVTYLFAMLGLAVLACALAPFVGRQEGRPWRANLLVAALVGVSALLFTYGLGSTYVSRFSEYEAAKLASFERYMATAILVQLLVVVFEAGLALADNLKAGPSLSVALVAMVALVIPLESAADLVTRETVAHSQEVRAPYAEMVEAIGRQAGPGDRVVLISQGDRGFDYWVVRFSVRPVTVDGELWSLGPEAFEGDIWSKDPGAQEWVQGLVEDGYSYVAIYRSDDRLSTGYAAAFEDPASIADGRIYRVDPEKGRLVLCE